MTYARRTDGNQTQLVRDLRKLGYLVRSNKTGNGSEDLTVSKRGWGCAVLLEVKREKGGRLTPRQIAAMGVGWPVYCVKSVDEALRVLQAHEAKETR